MECAPGEWLNDALECVPAGVPADGCAEGFVHDGDRGCEPVLPPAKCPTGQMAVPGETQCREIAPCGTGTWGDIPTELNTEHVDRSYTGGNSDGSSAAPWRTIGTALSAAEDGAIVALAAGSYPEGLLLRDKRVRLWGRCPSMVEISGSGLQPMTIDVRAGADGSVLRGFAVIGNGLGVVLRGSNQLELDQLWIHDCADRGIVVNRELGVTSFTLQNSLVERNVELGVIVIGGDGEISSSVVRDTLVNNQGYYGRGITVQRTDAGDPASLVLRGSLVEGNVDGGVMVLGASANVQRSVVRDTAPSPPDVISAGFTVAYDPTVNGDASLSLSGSVLERNSGGGLLIRAASAEVDTTVSRDNVADVVQNGGFGMFVDEDDLGPASLVLRASLVDGNVGDGVYANGSTLAIDSSVVRRTQLTAAGEYGTGVTASPHPLSGVPSSLTLRTSLIEDNHFAGVYVGASDATLSALVVRGTKSTTSGEFGQGVRAQSHPQTGAPATMDVDSVLLEHNSEVGLLVASSIAKLARSVVRATRPNGLGYGGRGVSVQTDNGLGGSADVGVFGTLVQDSVEAGIYADNSDIDVASCTVEDTGASAGGAFGDGILLASLAVVSHGVVTTTRVSGSARAAIGSFGATVALGDSLLSCQTFDVFGADHQGHAFAFEDRGGNLCGCPEADSACELRGEGIAPPPPVGGLE
jgi:hypothetical protein